MHIRKRSESAAIEEERIEAKEAEERRAQAMIEYIAAMDYPEIIPEEDREEEDVFDE